MIASTDFLPFSDSLSLSLSLSLSHSLPPSLPLDNNECESNNCPHCNNLPGGQMATITLLPLQLVMVSAL